MDKATTFISVLKALLKSSEAHGEKTVHIQKLKGLLEHYNL